MNIQESFQEIYKNLVRKYLERDWTVEDGISEADILKTEEKFGFKLPNSFREYYKTVGNCDELNDLHDSVAYLNQLPENLFDFKNLPQAFFDIDEDWRNDEDFLIFMSENQGIAYWALKADSFNQTDPVVWQIVNNSPPEFYSEEMTFSEFMTKRFDWVFNGEESLTNE